MTFAGAQLAQVAAERVINSVPGGMLIAALAWLVLRAVGKRNSGTRFVVWFSVLLAIAVLPVMPHFAHAGSVAHAMRAEITLPGSWVMTLFGLWIVFAACAAGYLLAGLWKVRRLSVSALALQSSSLDAALRETLMQFQAIRRVAVCSSPAVSVPTAIGFFQPKILIPDWALRDLPAEELKIILLHEFAHLRRWDDWTNLAQKIVRAVFFFHPAVWWIETKLSIEREMACDDAVLEETGNPRAYAECLVSLAEKSFEQRSLMQRSLAMAQAAISRAKETSIRLARILDPARPEAPRAFRSAWGLAAVAVAGLAMLPGIPQLIAFGNPVQQERLVAANERALPTASATVIPAALRTGGRLQNLRSQKQEGFNKAVPTLAIYQPAASFSGKPAPLIPAKQMSNRPPVHVVTASAKILPPPQEFFVVMQTTEFDQAGSVFMSVRVWRLTFIVPQENAPRQGVSAKSI